MKIILTEYLIVSSDVIGAVCFTRHDMATGKAAAGLAQRPRFRTIV